MKSTNPTNSSDLHHELQSGALGETYIKSFSQRTREQAGKLIADFLDGILFLFLVNRSPSSVRSPAPLRGLNCHPRFPLSQKIL